MAKAGSDQSPSLAEQARNFSLKAGFRISEMFGRKKGVAMVTEIPARVLGGLSATLTFNLVALPLDRLTLSRQRTLEKQAVRAAGMAEKMAKIALDHKNPLVSEPEFLARALPLDQLTPEIAEFIDKTGAAHLSYLCRAGLALNEERKQRAQVPARKFGF